MRLSIHLLAFLLSSTNGVVSASASSEDNSLLHGSRNTEASTSNNGAYNGGDPYYSQAGTINGIKMWYPEWRMRELVEVNEGLSVDEEEIDGSVVGAVDGAKDLEGERVLTEQEWDGYNIINGEYEDSDEMYEYEDYYIGDDEEELEEFYLTDEEIEEVLNPASFVPASELGFDEGDFDELEENTLEVRIERMLRRRHLTKMNSESDESNSNNEITEVSSSLTTNSNAIPPIKGQESSNNNRDLTLFSSTRGNAPGVNQKTKKNGKQGRNKRGQKTKTGNGGRNPKRGSNKHQTSNFRTCISRAIDPSNDLTGCDKILRNQYNLGAQMYKRGNTYKPPKPIPAGNGWMYVPPAVPPPKPYTNPYIDKDELLTDGIMHLSFLQDSVKADCNEVIRIEETVLRYLQNNVGDDDTFQPACAYVNEAATNEQIVRNADGRVATSTAMQVEVMYITKKKFADELEKQASVRRRELIVQALTEEGKSGGLRNLQVVPSRPIADVVTLMLAGLEDWQGHFQIVQTPPVDQGVEGLELEGLKDLIGLLDKESTGLIVLIDPIDPIVPLIQIVLIVRIVLVEHEIWKKMSLNHMTRIGRMKKFCTTKMN
ncbi:predicted protein [Thalassiosira pseudonana CCMP1335]|uniref:Uncharacterized protein n=1 Tax=Thalassiosira pseudonana TaxID=35128 RepID=B8C8M9_THAPS|nr:predicted protein [Thalassiosira pseudonana CCMP1335]EED90316.1 predicted protein [Thalassiosira pseudonana CCMP1335]